MEYEEIHKNMGSEFTLNKVINPEWQTIELLNCLDADVDDVGGTQEEFLTEVIKALSQVLQKEGKIDDATSKEEGDMFSSQVKRASRGLVHAWAKTKNVRNLPR